jgi:hypothetical protein
MGNKFRCGLMRMLLAGMLVLSLTSSAQTVADSIQLRNHVAWLTSTSSPRLFSNIPVLDSVAQRIYDHFRVYTDSVLMQEFKVNGKTYRNVIASFGTQFSERVVVGAHYDVCGSQPGADDNASGVSGLLELSRMLAESPLKYRIDLVAFSLEEPPYFRSPAMGSYIHAKSLADSKAVVRGMISLEMIGFFSEKKQSQDYPVGILKLFYGGRGNYITVVRKFGSGKFSRMMMRSFRREASIPVKSFKGPRFLPGIDFSDHLNYWKYGYSAMMITDTSFYRNKNYHTIYDTIDTLDFQKMAKVIDGLYRALLKL